MEVSRDKLWYYTERDVVPSDCRVKADDIYVLPIQRTIFRSGAQTFEDVCDNSRSECIYRLWMFMAQFIQQLRTQINGQDDHEKQLECFIEVVESEPTLRKSARTIYHHPSLCNSVEELIHRDASRDFYLPDIPGNDVAEYRIWICSTGLDEIDAIKKLLEIAFIERGGSNEDIPSIPRSARFKRDRTLRGFECWKEIAGVEELAMLFDTVYGKKFLSREEMINRARMPLIGNDENYAKSKDNPLHPFYTFNPVNLFRYQDRNNPICEIQRSLRKYFPDNFNQLYFPKPKNVLKMSPTSLSPEYIYNKYLFDVQKGMIVADSGLSFQPKKRRGIVPDFVSMPFVDTEGNEVDEDDAWKNAFRDHTEAMPAMFENLFKEGRNGFDNFNPDSLLCRISDGSSNTLRVESVPNMTDLQRIRLLSMADLKIIALKREQSLDAFREAYTAHQRWVFEEFGVLVLNEHSKVSAAAAAIIKEIVNTDLLDMKYKLPIFDDKLDVFGNLVAHRMECYEQYLFVYAAHKQLLIFNMGQLDAFRHDYGLHFNSFSIGKSATSKTYLFELMERCSVRGTMQVITYQSLKADASDDNQNDLTMILNEFSLKSVNDSDSSARGNVTTPEAMMKEKTTSGRTSAKYLERDPDTGKRTTCITVNDCIGCWFGASNDDPSQVSESFKSRYHWAMFQLIERPDRSIVNLTDAEASLTGKSKQKINNFVDHMKRMQCLHWIVEKLIMTGGLSDVSLTCTNILITHIDEYLQQHNIHVHSRTFTRIRILARVMTIHTALHYLYFIPINIVNADGVWTENFYEKPFDLDQLRSIDAYLCDEESIALFVIGLLNDQIVDPNEDIIRKCLRELHDTKKSKAQRYLFTGSLEKPDAQNGEANAAHRQLMQNMKNSSSNLVSSNDVPGSEVPVESTDQNAGGGSKGKDIGIYDYSYLYFKMKKEDVPQYIDRHYSSHSKPSLYQIKMSWEQICSRSDYLHSYYVEPGKEDMFPVRDTTKEKVYGPLVKTTDQMFCVHADLLNMSGRDKNILNAAIESTYHRFTRRRKIAYGETYSIKHPNLFKTISPTPSDRLLVTRNVLYMTDLSKELLKEEEDEDEVEDSNKKKNLRDIEFFYMDENLDTHTRRKRLLLLGIPPTPELIRAIHPEVIRQQLLLSDKCKIKKGNTYPESYITAKTEKENRFHEMKTKDLDEIKRQHSYALASNLEANYISENIPTLGLPDELAAIDIDGTDSIDIDDADAIEQLPSCTSGIRIEENSEEEDEEEQERVSSSNNNRKKRRGVPIKSKEKPDKRPKATYNTGIIPNVPWVTTISVK